MMRSEWVSGWVGVCLCQTSLGDSALCIKITNKEIFIHNEIKSPECCCTDKRKTIGRLCL